MKTMGAAKAKAHFLAVIDEVDAKKEPVVVTKNGRAVAQIVPMPLPEQDPIFGFYKGKIKIIGDITAPLYTDEEYEEFFQATLAQLNDPS